MVSAITENIYYPDGNTKIILIKSAILQITQEKAKILIATGRSTYQEHLCCIEQRKKTHLPEQHVHAIPPDAASSGSHNSCYRTSLSFVLNATSCCVTEGSY